MRRFCLFFVSALLSTLACGQGASPDINAPYRNPNYEEWRSRFETESREVYSRRHAIIGAGTGLFTRPIAARVGAGGRVYAVDIARAFVEGNLRRAREEGLENVIGIESTQQDTRLAAATIDLAFICDAYHHFEQPTGSSSMCAPASRSFAPRSRRRASASSRK